MYYCSLHKAFLEVLWFFCEDIFCSPKLFLWFRDRSLAFFDVCLFFFFFFSHKSISLPIHCIQTFVLALNYCLHYIHLHGKIHLLEMSFASGNQKEPPELCDGKARRIQLKTMNRLSTSLCPHIRLHQWPLSTKLCLKVRFLLLNASPKKTVVWGEPVGQFWF